MFRMIAHFLCSRSADKPGSVVGGHLSGTAVARRLMRPTRGSDGTGRPVQGQPQGLPLRRPCLALLPVGVAWPPGSPRTPVVSYTTFSPLPGREDGGLVWYTGTGIWYVENRQDAHTPPTPHSPIYLPTPSQPGGLFLWPYPSGYPAWALPSTVPCGARTFLTPRMARSATAWPTWSNFILTYSHPPVKQWFPEVRI
jgi:hypothetical protein